jgi:hypothetical protein
MNNHEIERILDDCLDRMRDGKSLQTILNDYPQCAPQLESLLKTAELGKYLPRYTSSPIAKKEGNIRLLNEVKVMKLRQKFQNNETKRKNLRFTERVRNEFDKLYQVKENINMKLVFRLTTYLLMTVIVAGFFTVGASASSLPGEPLYGIKRGWEKAQMALTFSEKNQQELENKLEQIRQEEVASLLSVGRSERVEYYGVIENKEELVWIIGGNLVKITSETELMGELENGAWVKVEAFTQEDGSLLALMIYSDFEYADEDNLDSNTDHDFVDTDNDLDDGMYDDLDDGMNNDSDNWMDDDTDNWVDDDTDSENPNDDHNDDDSSCKSGESKYNNGSYYDSDND